MMNKKLIKQNGFYKLIEGDFILAKVDFNGHSSIHYPIGKLSLKNCQFIESDFDLDELANSKWDALSKDLHFNNQDKVMWCGGFKHGLLEILGDKKYSEKDVISMIEKSRETGLTAEYLILNNQQNEWEVGIVTEEEFIFDPSMGISQGHYLNKPKLDEKGEIILKRI